MRAPPPWPREVLPRSNEAVVQVAEPAQPATELQTGRVQAVAAAFPAAATTHARDPKDSARSSGAKRKSDSRTFTGNIALRWSAGPRPKCFYKHLAPLEPEPIWFSLEFQYDLLNFEPGDGKPSRLAWLVLFRVM
jgi:hypothetical protein